MIRKTTKAILYTLLPVVIVAACSNRPTQNKSADQTAASTDTAKKKVVPIAVKGNALDTVTMNRKYNDIARYIAALKQLPGSTIPASYEKDTTWIRYCNNFNKEWKDADKSRFQPMNVWAATELASQRKQNLDIFYPFSGPDILHANIFFPQAKHYHLYGLERAGALPELGKMKTIDVDQYLSNVYYSLSDILVKSYFITKNMLKDLQKNSVNGTLPLMCVFLVRNDYEIVNVKYWHLNKDGSESPLSKDSVPVHTNDFVKVYFRHPGDSIIQVVSYMKCNMVDDEIKKNEGLMAFLNNMPTSTTYIKSASYLLHGTNFTVMRNAVLKKSASIVQDDTGVPYRFLPSKDWMVSLYGSYVKPVSSFPSGYFQPDLQKAYKMGDSLKTAKPLPFSLGYHWGSSNQNLIKAERKG